MVAFASISTVHLDRKSAWCARCALARAAAGLEEGETHERQLYMRNPTDTALADAWMQTREARERTQHGIAVLDGYLPETKQEQTGWVIRVTSPRPFTLQKG